MKSAPLLSLLRLTSILFWSVCVVTAFASPESPAIPAFSSSAKGNVFTDSQGTLMLHVPESITAGTLHIRDEHGNTIESRPLASASGDVAIALPGKGFYALEAEFALPDGTKKTVATTAAVVGPLIDDAIRHQSRIGLWTVQGDPDFTLAAGARWNRRMVSIHTLGEELLAPNPPADTKVTFPPTPFTQVGVMSFGLPRWLMEPTDKKKSYGNPLTKPKDWNQLKALVSTWVRQKGDNFPDYFEVYNEPEWQWTGGTNEELVRVLATISDGIKEARPQTKVLGPGFSSIRIKDPARLDLVSAEKMGLFDHLDGIVVHAYVDGTAPEGEFVRRVMDLQNFLKEVNRPDFPIHITEFGWTSDKGTWQKPVDEITQARYAVRSLTLLAALGVQNATYFCLQFKAAPNAGERGFSLLHEDSTPKPSFAAYSNLARWISNVRGLGTWLRLTPTTHLVLFERTDAPAMAVAWDTQEDREVRLPFPTTRLEDMMGRTLPASEKLALSPSPVFMEFAEQTLPQITMLPKLRAMRGGESVALPEGKGWIAPAPLVAKGNTLTVPPTASNGDYLLFAQSDKGWVGQPIEVVPPIEATAPVLRWAADQAAPELHTTLSSAADAPVVVRAAVSLEGTRDHFLESPAIASGKSLDLTVPLPGLELGKRYRGKLSLDSRYEGRRDKLTYPLDITLLAADRLSKGRPDWSQIAPVDFSTWEPFGGKMTPEDCSATLQSAYGADGLHLRVVVRDNEHVQTHAAEGMFSQDSIQIGLDPDYLKSWEANDLFGLKGHRVFEYGVGWSGKAEDAPMTWRWISYVPELPVAVAEPRIGLKVSREGDLTTYDIVFPWAVLGLDKAPPVGSAIGISLAVTDADSGRSDRRVLRLFGGIIDGKDPEKFGPLWLR